MEWAVIDMMVDASSDCFVDAADILLKLKTDEAKVRSWPEKTGENIRKRYSQICNPKKLFCAGPSDYVCIIPCLRCNWLSVSPLGNLFIVLFTARINLIF